MRSLKRVVIKEELVELTGDFKLALILNQFIYWTERVKDYDKLYKEEQQRAVEHGHLKEDIDLCLHGWIYKKADELAEELMIDCSGKTIRNHIKTLVQKGWLQQRTNPKYKWDKIYQYRVNLSKIEGDLNKLGHSLDGYGGLGNLNTESTIQRDEGQLSRETKADTSERNNFTSERNNFTSERNNFVAIPETTSENKKEKRRSKSHSPNLSVRRVKKVKTKNNGSKLDESAPSNNGNGNGNGESKKEKGPEQSKTQAPNQPNKRKENNYDRKEKYRKYAVLLSKIIQSQKNVKITTQQITKWSDEIRKLAENNEVSTERIKETLRWYQNNIGGEFVPVVESGAAFRNKFIRLEEAMQRSQKSHKPKNKPNNSFVNSNPDSVDYRAQKQIVRTFYTHQQQ